MALVALRIKKLGPMIRKPFLRVSWINNQFAYTFLRKNARVVLLATVCAISGCANISAVNVPGLGHFNFDPMPLTKDDKHKHYVALKKLFDQGAVGKSASWENAVTGASGRFTITRGFRRMDSAHLEEMRNAPCWEYTEYVHAQERQRTTTGKAACRVTTGQWKRIQ